MSRKLKYRNADDLLNNCTIKQRLLHLARCRYEVTAYQPNQPTIAKMLLTNSVARILFTLCRHIPASTRLVKRCTSKFCVNPYHYSEAGDVLRQRKAMGERGLNPSGLLPRQESI
jgi:hypothetical protein